MWKSRKSDMHFPDRGALAIRLTCCYGSIFKFVDKCRKNRFPTAKFQMFILLFEKSPSEFHQFPEQYLHKFQQESDTGLKMNLLQEFVFVALDIFKKNHQNRTIRKRLEGWLSFLSSDKPEDIIALIKKYPDFKPMYQQVYEICQNIEQVMGMFSKELYELDRNTVWYMIDELKKENKRWKEKDRQNTEEITRLRKEVEEMRSALLKESRELGEQGV